MPIDVNWAAPATEWQVQGAPKWMSQYAELLNRQTAEFAGIPYAEFRRMSPEQQEAIKNREVELTRHVREAPRELGVHKISVTGKSAPIEFTAQQMMHAMQDAPFARKLYTETTGINHPSHADILDFMRRIEQRLPEFQPQVTEQERQLAEYGAHKGRYASQVDIRKRMVEQVERVNQEIDGRLPAHEAEPFRNYLTQVARDIRADKPLPKFTPSAGLMASLSPGNRQFVSDQLKRVEGPELAKEVGKELITPVRRKPTGEELTAQERMLREYQTTQQRELANYERDIAEQVKQLEAGAGVGKRKEIAPEQYKDILANLQAADPLGVNLLVRQGGGENAAVSAQMGQLANTIYQKMATELQGGIEPEKVVADVNKELVPQYIARVKASYPYNGNLTSAVERSASQLPGFIGTLTAPREVGIRQEAELRQRAFGEPFQRKHEGLIHERGAGLESHAREQAVGMHQLQEEEARKQQQAAAEAASVMENLQGAQRAPSQLVPPPVAPPAGEPFEHLLQRAALERQRGALTQPYETIAPMNEVHAEAARMIRRSAEETPESDLVMRRELDKAHEQNLHEQMDPYLRGAARPVSEYMEDFKREMGPKIRDIADEVKKEYGITRHNLAGQFGKAGAYNTGARSHAEKLHAQNVEKALDKELMRMGYHYGDTQQARQAELAQIAGNRGKSQHEMHLRAAEAARQRGAAKKEAEHRDVSAISQLAQQQQQQRQNEIDQQKAEFLRQQQHPREQLRFQSEMLRGTPNVGGYSMTTTQGAAPRPPSAINTGIGALGTLLGMAQPHAKGGSIKGYADGGQVMAPWESFASRVQPGPHEGDMRNVAGELGSSYQMNPYLNWFANVGNTMLANPSGNPLQNLGDAGAKSMADRQAAYDKKMVAKGQSADLYNKINQSRLDQQKYIADYETHKAQVAENARHHAAHEGEMGRHHRAVEEEHLLKRHEKKAGDKKMEKEAIEGVTANLNALNSLKKLNTSLGEASTGPWSGWAQEKVGSDTADLIETQSGKLALDLQRGSKGLPRTQQTQNLIKETKPGIKHTATTNKTISDTYQATAVDNLNDQFHILMEQGWTPEKIEKHWGVKLNEDGHFVPSEEVQEKGKVKVPGKIDLSSMSENQKRAKLAQLEAEYANLG